MQGKLIAWLEIKPRITVIGAGLAAMAAALAVSQMEHRLLWLAAGFLAVEGLFLYARRWRLGLTLGFSMIVMYVWSSWRIAYQQSCLQVGQSGLHVYCIGSVRKLVTFARGTRLYVAVNQVMPVSDQAERSVKVSSNGSYKSVATILVHLNDPIILEKITLAVSAQTLPLLKMEGRLQTFQPARFPWEFDEAGYYRRQGIAQKLWLCGAQPVQLLGVVPACDDVYEQCVQEYRQTIVAAHQRVLGQKLGALLSSMVIGDKAIEPDAETRQQFRDLGLSHLVAASGFNLTVVAVVAWWMIRFVTRSALVSNIWCLAWIIAFCMLAGFSPSVQRAALMCTVFMCTASLRRSLYLPASIAFALIVSLIIDPLTISDAGLQLSYIATFCISIAASRLKQALAGTARLPIRLADTIAVVVVANASVLPLQMIYFWQVGELALVANAMVAPLVAPITILGFIASVLASANNVLLAQIAQHVDCINGIPLVLMIKIVDWLASFKWVVPLRPPAMAAVIAYYIILVLWLGVLAYRGQARVRRAAIVLGVVSVVVAAMLFYRRLPSHTTVLLLPDAMLIATTEGNGLVIGNPNGTALKKALLFLAVKREAIVPMAAPTLRASLRKWQGRSRLFQLTDDKLRTIHHLNPHDEL